MSLLLLKNGVSSSPLPISKTDCHHHTNTPPSLTGPPSSSLHILLLASISLTSFDLSFLAMFWCCLFKEKKIIHAYIKDSYMKHSRRLDPFLIQLIKGNWNYDAIDVYIYEAGKTYELWWDELPICFKRSNMII